MDNPNWFVGKNMDQLLQQWTRLNGGAPPTPPVPPTPVPLHQTPIGMLQAGQSQWISDDEKTQQQRREVFDRLRHLVNKADDNKKLQKQLDQANAQLKTTKAELEKLVAKSKMQSTEKRSAQTQTAYTLEAFEKLVQERNLRLQTETKITAECEELRKKAQQMKTEMDALKEELDCEKELATLNAKDTEMLQNELHQAKTALEDKCILNAKLKSIIKQLEESERREKAQNESHSSKISELQAKVERQKQGEQTLLERIASLEEAAEQSEAERGKCKDKLSESEKAVEEMRANLAKMSEICSRLERENEQRKHDLDCLAESYSTMCRFSLEARQQIEREREAEMAKMQLQLTQMAQQNQLLENAHRETMNAYLKIRFDNQANLYAEPKKRGRKKKIEDESTKEKHNYTVGEPTTSQKNSNAQTTPTTTIDTLKLVVKRQTNGLLTAAQKQRSSYSVDDDSRASTSTASTNVSIQSISTFEDLASLIETHKKEKRKRKADQSAELSRSYSLDGEAYEEGALGTEHF